MIDPARADRVLSRFPEDALVNWTGEAASFLKSVFAAAPYLGRLAVRRSDTLKALGEQAPDGLLADCLTQLEALSSQDLDEAAARLRHAKMDAHLIIALSDLAGVWTLKQTVEAMTDLADQAVRASVRCAVLAGGQTIDDPLDPLPGYFVLALGKQGTRTLNYSSDIDPVVLFDPDRLDLPDDVEPQKYLNRVTQRWVKLMQDITSDGYVFRVDLRLRPDPSATPVAVSTVRAQSYFEATGQNWERAAWSKARVCAGDRQAARNFLQGLEPFIWRRSLDYAAVEDIHVLARQIQAIGDRADIVSAGHDLKLGRGGIREIEFYAQIPQLVFGGRDPRVRAAGTVPALTALSEIGLEERAIADQMISDYRTLRAMEHRIQMLEDEQSQTLPKDDERRRAVAALMGETDLNVFDENVVSILKRVHTTFSNQFSEEDSLATHAGSLVLTGVEPAPDTLKTLEALGFSKPNAVWSKFAGWASGKARAARTERARRLFSSLAPGLVEAMAESGDPDTTLSRFGVFFEGLPSGVQLLSLLNSHPELTRDLIQILSLAPRLGEQLARRPALIDVMLDPRFASPLQVGDIDEICQWIQSGLIEDHPLESLMDQARRVVREEKLKIGSHILLERSTVRIAGQAYTRLAEATVITLSQAVLEEMEARYGPAPGQWAVLGLGKMGSRELMWSSDLDIMLVYELDKTVDQQTKLGPDTWFHRFTQRLVAAVSAPTSEGDLYEVDLALRPSGKSGPIAVNWPRLIGYYQSEAWTWERMAMTRMRPLCGPAMEAFSEKLIATNMDYTPDEETVRADARSMRQRLERDKPARSKWDLKLRPGGLIDLEFLAQTGQLLARQSFSTETQNSLQALGESAYLSSDQATTLVQAWRDFTSVLQLIRLAHGSDFNPSMASTPFMDRLSRSIDCQSPGELNARLEEHASKVRAIFEDVIGTMSHDATD